MSHVSATLATEGIGRDLVSSIAADVHIATTFQAIAETVQLVAQPEAAKLIELGKAHQVTNLAGFSDALSSSVVTQVGGLSGIDSDISRLSSPRVY